MSFLSWFKCLQRQDGEDFIDVEDFMITKIIPPEIMEFIFAELNLKDIRSCSRTCYRWKYIISAMFRDKSEFFHRNICHLEIRTFGILITFSFTKFLAKVMIVTGYPFEVGQRTEILDLIDPYMRYNLITDIPSNHVTVSRHGLLARYGCVGGLIDNEPFICGGEYDSGNKFSNGFVVGQPHKKLQMLETRFGAAGVGMITSKISCLFTLLNYYYFILYFQYSMIQPYG